MEPVGVAGGVAFAFPDGDAGFDLVDDPAAGLEGGAAVAGAGADPDRQVAQGEFAGAVHAGGGGQVETGDRLFDDALALGFGQFAVGLVEQALHRPTLVVVAHPALEAGVGAGPRRKQALAQRRDVEGFGADGETFHPPDTGGMKATSQPARSGASHEAKAPSTATRRRSAGSAKP